MGWEFEYEGDRRSLADWGIEDSKLKLISFGVDTFTFSVAGIDINSSPGFAFEKIANLYFNGTRYCSCRVARRPASMTSPADRQKYILQGPWADFDAEIFVQDRKIPVDTSDPNSPLQVIPISDVVLFQNLNGDRINPATQMSVAVSRVSLTVNAVVGTLEGGITPPFESGRDQSTSEVIRRCARWVPNSIGFFDYSAPIPTFNVRTRANLTAVTFDANATVTLLEAELESREDIQPSGLVVYIQQPVLNAAGAPWNAYRQYSFGQFGGLRCLVMTIPSSDSDAISPTSLELFPSDFWASIKDLSYSGTIRIRAENAIEIVRPGFVVNLTNARSDFATMAAVVQSVTYDLTSSIAEITLGPPAHWGAGDLISLMKTSRSTSDGTKGAGGIFDGGSPTTGKFPSPSGSYGPRTSEQITVCDNGTEKTINVFTA